MVDLQGDRRKERERRKEVSISDQSFSMLRVVSRRLLTTVVAQRPSLCSISSRGFSLTPSRLLAEGGEKRREDDQRRTEGRQRGQNNSSNNNATESKNMKTLKWLVAVTIGVVGLSYAAVPLYRMFCSATGYGGTIQTDWWTPKKGLKRDHP